MRDHQQRAGIGAQPVLQPQHGIDVEVVGRLVQQEQVGGAHQRASEVEAHAVAAGEFLHGAIARIRWEPEARKQGSGARARRVAVGMGEPLVGQCKRVAIVFVMVGRFGFADGGLGSAQPGVRIEQVFEDRLVEGRRDLLDPCEARAGLDFAFPAVGCEFAGHQ